MIRRRELPLFALMMFTIIYAIFGEPTSRIWSGLYFFVNYLTLLKLFQIYNNKVIRYFGMSISVMMLVFILIKYFLNIDINREFSIIPFMICLITLIKLDYERTSER